MMSEDVRKQELAPLQSIRDNYEKIVLSLEPGLNVVPSGFSKFPFPWTDIRALPEENLLAFTGDVPQIVLMDRSAEGIDLDKILIDFQAGTRLAACLDCSGSPAWG